MSSPIEKKPFYEKPLAELTRAEWEQLCDGCGLCCVNKLEDEDTGEIYFTRVACQLLDLNTCRCQRYSLRKIHVPDCIKLTLKLLPTINWLPPTCAYWLRFHDLPLPEWHYLICHDKERVHKEGISLKGRLIHETPNTELADHIIGKYEKLDIN